MNNNIVAETSAELVTMKKCGIFPRKIMFLVNSDGTYRQIQGDSMSVITNDFADLFLTLYSKGWRCA